MGVARLLKKGGQVSSLYCISGFVLLCCAIIIVMNIVNSGALLTTELSIATLAHTAMLGSQLELGSQNILRSDWSGPTARFVQ